MTPEATGDGHIVATDYLLGKLSSEERRRADRHLDRCSQCRAAVEAVRGIRNRHTRQVGVVIVDFLSHLVRGSTILLAPPLRRLSMPTPARPTEGEPRRKLLEPLRVLQPRVVQGVARLFSRFGLVLGLTLTVLLIPTPEGLSPEAHRALAAFVFTSSILALEPVSLPIAALMVPVAVVALGLGEAREAFEPFSRPVVFLILASLFLAEALHKHGLTRRLALLTIVASGGPIRRLLLGLMGLTAFLSMWVGSTATTAMLIPVALTISRQVEDRSKAKRLLVLLALGIAYSASLGGMATIMGATSNAVASGLLAEIQPWSFLDWMLYGLPSLLLMFPLTWWLLLWLIPSGVETLDVRPARERVEKLGSVSPPERQIMFTVGAAAFFWVTGDFLEPLLSLPSTLLSAAMVAVIAVAYLALRRVIDWEDVKGVSWGIFLIIGAGLSLGEALGRSGATEWFASLITPLVTGPPFLLSLIVLVLLSAIFTNLMNNTTIAAVFVPILITLAQSDPSLSATQLVLPVTLATTFGYSLPSASGRMALVSATGIIDSAEMLRYGLIVTLISSVVLALFFYGLFLLNWI